MKSPEITSCNDCAVMISAPTLLNPPVNFPPSFGASSWYPEYQKNHVMTRLRKISATKLAVSASTLPPFDTSIQSCGSIAIESHHKPIVHVLSKKGEWFSFPCKHSPIKKHAGTTS